MTLVVTNHFNLLFGLYILSMCTEKEELRRLLVLRIQVL